MSEAKQLFGSDTTDNDKRQFKELLTKLGFGSGTSGAHAGNFGGNCLNVTFSSANANQAVAHGLGRTPVFCFPLLPPNKAGAVLQYIGKDSSSITLACNVAGTSFTIYVE